jgi:putative heme uptake system protein
LLSVTDAATTPTYVLVDGENIDATLGMSVLGHRPGSDERPRWERLRDFVAERWQQPVTGLFFLNASSGFVPSSFVQALIAMRYRPIPLSGAAGLKVVDIGIQRTLEAIASRPGDVVLASHDGDFVDQMTALCGTDRRVAVVGFREFLNLRFSELTSQGLQIFDLEDDVRAFTSVLPRVRIIELDDFDPGRFL